MPTAALPIDRAQEKVSADRTTIGLPAIESTHLLYVLDQAELEYFEVLKIGGEGDRSIYSEGGGLIPSATNLAADVAVDATSLTVDSIADATSGGGAALIRDKNMEDRWEYTNGSSTTITGVTGISFPHENDDQVRWLPILPSDWESMRSTQKSEDGILVDDIPYKFTTGKPSPYEYALYEASGGRTHIIFPDGLTGDWFMTYNSNKTAIDEETDSLNIPDKDVDFLTFRLVEHIYMSLDPITFVTQALLARKAANRILMRSLKRRNVGKRVKLARHPLPGPYMNDRSLYRQT